MFLPLLLLLQDAPAAQSAVAAERAFAADAQAMGQWTAFSKWAAEEGVMFVPAATNARQWLKDRKDPPKSVEWWPTESYVSCDGNTAVNTGGWVRPDGSTGYFTTVWQRQKDGGWKWLLDHGDTLAAARPRPAEPRVARASCGKAPAWESDDDAPGITDTGASADSTLIWRWIVWPDGERSFEASSWDGEAWVPVVSDKVAAPK